MFFLHIVTSLYIVIMITNFFKKSTDASFVTQAKSKNFCRTKQIMIQRDASSSSKRKRTDDECTDDDESTHSNVKRVKHKEHVLLRAETYIGSVKKTKQFEFLGIRKGNVFEIKNKQTVVVPGLLSVIDEIIVNGIDHHRRSQNTPFPVRNLKITVDENGVITIFNDGNGMPIEKVDGEWGPTLCVGHLLTSENYNDSEKRLVGGRNGLGAALTNIWSVSFDLETVWVHPESKKASVFKQSWKTNMNEVSSPSITNSSRKTGQTSVTFKLDFERFKVSSTFVKTTLSQILCRRACDIAATCPSLKVFFNDQQILLKSCVPTSRMYPPLHAYGSMLGGTHLTYCNLGERWECVVLVVPDTEEYPLIPSFVNGLRCDEGGPFVDAVEKELMSGIRKYVKSKTKVDLRKSDIKNRVRVIVSALIENPEFRTQTKHYCTTREFGSTPAWKTSELDRAIKNVYPVVEEIAHTKSKARTKRLIGAVHGVSLVINKYDGAKHAGTKRHSSICSLWLTEGDSAKSFVITGLGALPQGRKTNGVFPLKGKLINVRKFTDSKVMQNTEIQNLTKIIGLQPGVKAVRDKLRYGRVVIVTDQDVDGSHIKGLLLNFFHYYWPETLHWEGFLCVFHTPLIVAKWGRNQKKLFYTRGQFDAWKDGDATSIRGWSHKHYKGLATSSAVEAKSYFTNMGDHIVPFDHESATEEVHRWLNVGFSDDKQYKDERKQIVYSTLDTSHTDIVTTIPKFVKRELTCFWFEDNARSIPNVVDGFKESQRKIFFAMRKKNTRSEKTELRVAQVAAYTSEHTAYEHGEESLNKACILMAQTYMGSNNINLLHPQGMFGTRLATNDAGSPRYIHTFLTEIGDRLFPPANDVVLTYLLDNMKPIEPEHYVPVIPFLLVNGSHGIGTGVVTDIWSYNPVDIIRLTRQHMNGQPMDQIQPWVRNFKGSFSPENRNGKVVAYRTTGVVVKDNNNHVTITELFPGKTTDKYVEWLREKCPFVSNVETDGTEETVQLSISGDFPEETNEHLVTKLHLSHLWYTNRMNAFEDVEGKMTLKPFDVHGIVTAHHRAAMDLYTKRRLHEIDALEMDLQEKREKAHFIQGWVGGAIRAGSGSKEQVVEWMGTGDFSSDDQFQKLRRLPNEQLFAEKIKELEDQMTLVSEQLSTLEGTTPMEIWERDLNAFDTFYQQWIQ